MAKSASGSCLCKAVVFQVDLPTLYCGHCHCSMCRKNHGAGYVTWFAVPRTRFRVIEGQSSIERYQSSEGGWREFCKRCGSPLFANDGETNILVSLGVMDEPIDRKPDEHWFFADRIDWVPVDQSLPEADWMPAD